ncbi:MAG: hypothetical protein HYX35_01185 [Proteobacteria bacterium]|nr:hypothetical protein [Pseudomonadota bacterium]
MFGPVVSMMVATFGVVTEKDVLPTFFPYQMMPPLSVEEVCEHLQSQPDFMSFMKQYKSFLQTRTSPTSQQERNKLVALPLSGFISSNEQILKDKIFQTVKNQSYRFLREAFPWEMYDVFVPKIEPLGSYLGSGVAWFQRRYRSESSEGKFFRRLENEDYFTAGAMAHYIAQYCSQSLSMEWDLYAFVLDNSTFHPYKKLIRTRVDCLKKMHAQWNGRRLNLYRMNHALLQAREMQLVLKLKAGQANDTDEAADCVTRISDYERLINALQVAFYNQCMEEKGLTLLERIWNRATHFVEKVGVFFSLDEESQTPLEFSTYLSKLVKMVEEDKKIELRIASVDPQNWDAYDWQLKPPTEFQRRFENEEADTKVTPENFLFNLLVQDNIEIALRFCKLIDQSKVETEIWAKQQKRIGEYSTLLKDLFNKQKEIDDVLTLLRGEAYGQFDKEEKEKVPEKPSQLYASMRECEDVSLQLFNSMVVLKWSFLKTFKDNFNKEKGIFQRASSSLTRKTLRMITEGTIWDKTPNFDTSQEEAKRLLADADGVMFSSKRLLGHVLPTDNIEDVEFVVLTEAEMRKTPSFSNQPPVNSIYYWQEIGLDMDKRARQSWQVVREWSWKGVSNAVSYVSTALSQAEKQDSDLQPTNRLPLKSPQGPEKDKEE